MSLFDETTEVLDWETFNVESSTRGKKDLIMLYFKRNITNEDYERIAIPLSKDNAKYLSKVLKLAAKMKEVE